MKLTTKGRFAVTALLDIAMHDSDEYIKLVDIGNRRHLSSSYLEQLFSKLRKAGLVEGIRGPAGGYRLARSASEINVAEILDAVDATLQEARCEKSRKGCDGEGECITFDLWNRLNEEMRRFLSSVTLASLAEKKRLEDSGVHVVRIDQLKKHK
jgi:Rrf2 family iron-sulfur cluster assembly transcriptional regulator